MICRSCRSGRCPPAGCRCVFELPDHWRYQKSFDGNVEDRGLLNPTHGVVQAPIRSIRPPKKPISGDLQVEMGSAMLSGENADGTEQQRLTNNPANDMVPSWSPDGKKIVFDSDRDGNLEIYVMNADGSNQIRLTYNPADDWDPSWSPGGK